MSEITDRKTYLVQYWWLITFTCSLPAISLYLISWPENVKKNTKPHDLETEVIEAIILSLYGCTRLPQCCSLNMVPFMVWLSGVAHTYQIHYYSYLITKLVKKLRLNRCFHCITHYWECFNNTFFKHIQHLVWPYILAFLDLYYNWLVFFKLSLQK